MLSPSELFRGPGAERPAALSLSAQQVKETGSRLGLMREMPLGKTARGRPLVEAVPSRTGTVWVTVSSDGYPGR
ncbi:ABC transporter-like protein [Anopheles sinensis]|uniref:ABC transporter-like protein n=1 Tax=Anopheles sinensis TaxID=74873 RepID=A0A084V9Y0_ANOSI|nr:ABC transporter-like protein [Anopheles sinensis]